MADEIDATKYIPIDWIKNWISKARFDSNSHFSAQIVDDMLNCYLKENKITKNTYSYDFLTLRKSVAKTYGRIFVEGLDSSIDKSLEEWNYQLSLRNVLMSNLYSFFLTFGTSNADLQKNMRKQDLRRKLKLSNEEIKNLINDRKNGMKYKEISEKYHINYGTIKRYLNEDNLKITISTRG